MALSLPYPHLQWGWNQRSCSYVLTAAYLSLPYPPPPYPYFEWGWSQRLCSYDLTTAYISLPTPTSSGDGATAVQL